MVDPTHPLVRVGLVFLVFFWSSVVSVVLFFRWLFNREGFTKTRRHTLPEKLNSKEYKHKYAQLSSVKLHYVELGKEDAPLMLFVHGFPEFWWSWRHQLKEFAKDYRVVALDQRGYGESDKPKGVNEYTVEKLTGDIGELVKHLGYKKFFLVGHDWGAVVCFAAAARFPELVEKLVIMNGPHPVAFFDVILGNPRQMLKSWYMFLFQSPFLPEFAISSFDYGAFNKVYEPFIKKGTADADDVEATKYYFSQPGALTAPINYYRSLMRNPVLNDPKYIVQPETLVIWGTADVALLQDCATKSVEYCKKGTIKFIEGGDHFIQEDEPRQVNNLIREFIEGKH